MRREWVEGPVMSQTTNTHSARRGKGFRRTAALVEPRVKNASAKRGFAVARVLTHWAEIVGEEIARAARPVDVKYGREGFGATLTLLVRGAEAPLLEMQKERIRETVNACYGYNAIQKIRFTQTAASGFGEAAEPFEPAPVPPPAVTRAAEDAASGVADEALRKALEALGSRILCDAKQTKRSPS